MFLLAASHHRLPCRSSEVWSKDASVLCSRAWRFRLFCASGCGPSDGGSLSSVDVGLGTRRGSCYDKGERSAKVSASPFSSVDGGSVLILCSVLFAVSRSVPYARTVWFRRGGGADGKVPWSVELRSSSTVV